MNKILIGVFCLVALATAFPSQDNTAASNLNVQPAIAPVPAGDGAQGVAADSEDGDVGSRHYGGGGYGRPYGGGGYGGGGYGGGYGGHQGGYGGHQGGYGGGYGRPYGGHGGHYYG